MKASKVPQSDWEKLGLFYPKPDYSEGVYSSRFCRPTKGEVAIYKSHLLRTPVTVRDALHLIVEPDEESNLRSDVSSHNYIRVRYSDQHIKDPLPEH